MEISELSEEDRKELRDSLLQWKEDGNENPLIPLDVDIDGDGIVDSFGLNEDDELIIVSGKKLDETVYVSEGDDISEAGDDE